MSTTQNLSDVLSGLIQPLEQLFTMLISFYFQIYIIKMLFSVIESLVSTIRIPG